MRMLNNVNNRVKSYKVTYNYSKFSMLNYLIILNYS